MEPIYITTNPNFTEIENGIFIRKNFLSDENYKDLLDATTSLSEDDWNTHPTDPHEDGKISINLHQTMAISQALIDFIIPKYWINEHKTVNRINSTHFPARFGWDDWNAADYLAILYFGEFEGGDLKCYEPNFSEEHTLLKIETNTLYLLPIMDTVRYQSEKVTSGTKYSYVDWIYRHAEWAIP